MFRPVVTGVHTSPIAMLAVTEDASAALTSAGDGGLRLWPTLDGSREPIVLDAPDPVDLAIAHSSDSFAIAIVDQAKTLDLFHVDTAGHVLDRAQVATDIASLQSTPVGFLALTTDQRIEVIAFDGAVTQLAPKQRVLALLYRSGRALALFQSQARVKGQWIDLDTTAAWGDEIKELAIDVKRIDLAHAVLSPDHTHLAVTSGNRMLGFALATGTSSKLATACEPYAYLDDNTIACTDGSDLTFVTAKGKRLRTAKQIAPQAFALAGNQLVFGNLESLGFADAKAVHYLGYTVAAVQRARPIGKDLVLQYNSTRMLADANLAFVRKFATDENATDVIPLSPTSEAKIVLQSESQPRYALIVDKKTVLDPVNEYQIHYEPTTGLLAVSAGNAVRFIRVVDGKLGPVSTLLTTDHTRLDTTDTTYLTDPALADGVTAMVVHGTRIFELRDADITGKKITASKVIEANDAVVAIDRAGHLFTLRSKVEEVTQGDIIYFGSGGYADAQPSPDGKLIAFVTGPSIQLFDTHDGALKWKVDSRGRTIGWTPDSQLLAISGGIERLDMATGEPTSHTCGFKFVISPVPLDDVAAMGDQVCER